MRKKYSTIAISLIYAALLSSCQLDGPDRTREEFISFSSPAIKMDMSTRADGPYDFLDAIPNGTSFGVLGYCLAYNPGETTYNPNSGTSQWSLKRNLCPPSVFYNTEVTVKDGGAIYNPLKKWYADGVQNDGISVELSGTDDFRYTFYAYYPYDPNLNDGSGFSISPANSYTAGAPVITYTMPFNGSDKEATIDGYDEKVPDAMLSVQQNVQRGSQSVEFNFSHIMTGLGFQINNFSQVAETVEDESDEGVDLKIYSIKLKGTFHKSVKVDMTDAVASISYKDTYSGTYTIFEANEGKIIPWNQDGSRGSITMEPEIFLRLLPGNEADGYFGPTPDSNDNENDPNPVLIVDYQLGENDRKTEQLKRLTNFQPRSGVRYTAQINWVNNAFILIMQANNGEIWEDGGADDNEIIFM